MGTHKLHWV